MCCGPTDEPCEGTESERVLAEAIGQAQASGTHMQEVRWGENVECRGSGKPVYIDYAGPGGGVIARCPVCRCTVNQFFASYTTPPHSTRPDEWTEFGGTVLPESERLARYEAMTEVGLGHNEATEVAWPSQSPDMETVTFPARDVGIFICPVCEAVIEGDNPCPRRGLKQHGDAALEAGSPEQMMHEWRADDRRLRRVLAENATRQRGAANGHEPDNPQGVWCCDEHRAAHSGRRPSDG
jgi:hypothetical protein